MYCILLSIICCGMLGSYMIMSIPKMVIAGFNHIMKLSMIYTRLDPPLGPRNMHWPPTRTRVNEPPTVTFTPV